MLKHKEAMNYTDTHISVKAIKSYVLLKICSTFDFED